MSGGIKHVSKCDGNAEKAKAGHYASTFNINNLEWTKAILLTAQELKSRLSWVFLKVQVNTWQATKLL